MKKKFLILSSRIPKENGKADQITVYKFLEYLQTNDYPYKIISTYFPWQSLTNEFFKNELILIRLDYFHLVKSVIKFFFSKYPLAVCIFDEDKIKKKVDSIINEEKITDVYCHLIRTSIWVSSKKKISTMCSVPNWYGH